MPKYIVRKKNGKRFTYFLDDKKIFDSLTTQRIKKLAIPPGWSDVKISSDPSAKVQATGFDSAGRKQSKYHADYRTKQEIAKFERILHFADRLPKLRKEVEKDMAKRKLSREKVLATIVKLIDEAYFRPGNEIYARENQTYGITTMRSKHVEITSNSVTFDFIGKSGQQHHKTINDRQVARIIKQLDELPGYDLFRYIDDEGSTHPIVSSDVNEYIKNAMGDDFSAKDFRTWGGTMLTTSFLALEKRSESKKELKKSVTKVVKQVSKKLGNTPAVARSSYIDPRVIDSYIGSDVIAEVYATIKNMRPKKYIKNEEIAVIKLLKKAS